MKGMTRKIFSSVMAVMLVVGMMPTSALAYESVDASVATQEETEESTTLSDGTYSIGLTSSMGMIKPMTGDEASYLVVDGETSYVVFNATSSPDGNGAVKYDAIYNGKRSEAPEDASTADVIEGIPFHYGDSTTESYTYELDESTSYTFKCNDGEGIVYGYSYVIPISTGDLETLLNDGSEEDVYFVARYSAGYTSSSGSTSSASTWSGSSDNYLTLSDLVWTSDSTELPGVADDDSGDDDTTGDDGATDDGTGDDGTTGNGTDDDGTTGDEDDATEAVSLAVTNNTTMFKVTEATLAANDDGTYTLTVTMSGSGYHYFYKGTYEEACVVGDDTSEWIAGYQNDDGKWVFEITVDADETEIPIVSISNSKYSSYLEGSAELESAFMSRLFVLDVENLTLVTGDYEATVGCSVLDFTTDLEAGDTAVIDTVGSPASNSYSYAVTITLPAGSYDMAYVGTAEDAATASDDDFVSISDDGTLTLNPTTESGSYTVSTMGSGISTEIAIRDASTQEWTTYIVTPDLLDCTVTIEQESYTLEDIEALIMMLPDFPDVTLDDADLIEYVESLYEALSEEDQATLDETVAADEKYETYGRSLEVAAWGLASLQGVYGQTDLEEGIYNGISSEYSKGKSTSSRNRPWSVSAIYVDADGNATAAITVESTTYTYVRVGGELYYNVADEGENCVFLVPIDPDSTLYFSGYSTSMKSEIAFTLDITDMPTEAIDASALVSAMETAKTAIGGATISEDGSELDIGESYVTSEDAEALEDAISDAYAVLYSASSTVDDMAAAAETLEAAIEAFSAAITDVSDLGWTRLYGSDRYETAVAIAEEGWGQTGCEYAIVASGSDFPDALAASSLAGVFDCPVLLSATAELGDSAAAELEKLGVGTVYIVGGTSSVSDGVEKQIEDMGIAVERVAGQSRTETSEAVMDKVVSSGMMSGTVVIAYGYDFADALSISPYAFSTCSPILLTDSSGTLTESEVEAIEALDGIDDVLIVGGTSSVSEEVETQLGNGYSYTRKYGKDRYLTSLEIAKYEIEAGMDASNPGVATGTSFPDALSGGAFCGSRNSVLLLVNDDDEVVDGVIDYLVGYKDSRVEGYIYGGASTISKDVMDAIEEGTK